MGQAQVKYWAQRDDGTESSGAQLVAEVMCTKVGHAAFIKIHKDFSDEQKQKILE